MLLLVAQRDGDAEHGQHQNSKHSVQDDNEYFNEETGLDEIVRIVLGVRELFISQVVARAYTTIVQEAIHLHQNEVPQEEEGCDEAEHLEHDRQLLEIEAFSPKVDRVTQYLQAAARGANCEHKLEVRLDISACVLGNRLVTQRGRCARLVVGRQLNSKVQVRKRLRQKYQVQKIVRQHRQVASVLIWAVLTVHASLVVALLMRGLAAEEVQDDRLLTLSLLLLHLLMQQVQLVVDTLDFAINALRSGS